MAIALDRFGTRSLAETLAPSITFAEAGFPIDWYQGMLIASQQHVLGRDAETARIFLTDGLPPAPLFDQSTPKLTQPDLARTLRRIAADGPDAFYTGEIADRIATHVQSLGGILTTRDLAEYQPV